METTAMTAKWITDRLYDGRKLFTFEARKSFSLQEVPATAKLRVTADARYSLEVNGLPVLYGPIRGSRSLQFFDEADIARFLRRGENELRLLVGSTERNYIVDSVTSGLWLELEGILASDESWETRPMHQWRRDVPDFTFQMGYMEWRDDRRAPGEWRPAIPLQNVPQKQLTRNPLPPMTVSEHLPADIPFSWQAAAFSTEVPEELPYFINGEALSPLPEETAAPLGALLVAGGECRIPPCPGLRIILDFGREISGRFSAEIEAPTEISAEITYDEELQGGVVKAGPEGWSRSHFTDCYVLKSGRSRIGTRLAERGFRYVQLILRNLQQGAVLRNVRGIDERYPVPHAGHFFCSDPLLNRIWEVCEETASICISDVMMDCPWRERGFWVNDMVVNNAVTLGLFGAQELHRRCLRLAFSQPAPDGMLPAIAPVPADVEIGRWLVFVPANLFMVFILRDYLLSSGDRDTVRQYLPAMEGILEAIWKLADEQGILQTQPGEWHFYDWSFEINDYHFAGQRESMLNALFVWAVREFLHLSKELGYGAKEAEWEARRRKTALGILKEFWRPAEGRLVDHALKGSEPTTLSSQLAHALWLLCGEMPEQARSAVVAALDNPALLKPEYYLHHFWFQAATLCGKEQEALERIREHWGRCIQTGSNTLYEAGIHAFGKEAFGKKGSLCHGFGTSPVLFLQRVILGVTPLEPAYRRFRFAPDLLGLSFAEGRVPTPAGNINVTIRNGELLLTVPPLCTALLPDGTELPAGRHSVGDHFPNIRTKLK